MRKSISTKVLASCLVVCMLFSSVSCSVDADTTASLVELVAASTGSLVEIVLTAVLNNLVNLGQFTIDLAAPISTQEH